jgi:alpha-L-fucosidase
LVGWGLGSSTVTYWKSTEFLTWSYNSSPVKDTAVVTNDGWGSAFKCKHGGYFSCDDAFNPGKLFPHKWENAMTVDKGCWGFRRLTTADDYPTSQDIISELVSTVSWGGNLLLNVGPTK